METILTFIIAICGFLIILQILHPAKAFLIILVAGVLLLLTRFFPIDWHTLHQLPLIVKLFGAGLLALMIIRPLLWLFLGRSVADRATGTLAADLIRLVAKVIILPIRGIGWIFRQFSGP
jgi:cytochrome b561